MKLVPGHVESRKADVESGWVGVEHHKDDSYEEDQEVGEDNDEQAGSDEEDEDVDADEFEEPDDDDSEENELDSVPVGKRKRPSKPTSPPALSNKKVSFAPDPKESKRARTAASVKKTTSPAPKSRPVSSKLKTSKAINVRVSQASQKSKAGEEAYDFGKFF